MIEKKDINKGIQRITQLDELDDIEFASKNVLQEINKSTQIDDTTKSSLRRKTKRKRRQLTTKVINQIKHDVETFVRHIVRKIRNIRLKDKIMLDHWKDEAHSLASPIAVARDKLSASSLDPTQIGRKTVDAQVREIEKTIEEKEKELEEEERRKEEQEDKMRELREAYLRQVREKERRL